MTIAIGQTLAHYRLIEQIGEGGMGVVWRALDRTLNREVALKILSETFASTPDRLTQFEREAKILAALSHPNIVTVYSVEEADGRRFFTMELIRGRSLTELLPPEGLPLKRLFSLAVPIVDGVAAAHAQGLVHGDLKPGNVMVTDEDRVKVLDFGLARSTPAGPVRLTSDDPTQTHTVAGQISGTVQYMSPEQIQGGTLDGRSDVFALGIMLYEMATGRRPFDGASMPEVIAAVLKDVPPPPSRINPEIPRQLNRIIENCLIKDLTARTRTANTLRKELRDLERSVGAPLEETVRSVAVLPFADMSADKDQDYFCEGMADEIINALGRVEDLRVASRTSSFQFKAAALDSREIGDRLGVSNLLEGSVRKAGNQLRISAQLTNVIDGYQLWAESYDRELRDVFAIQDQIAQSIVEALEVTLSPRERRAIKQVQTANVEAYDYFLQGQQHFRQFRRKSIEVAGRMFMTAIDTDPNYAGAYAGLADCHSYLYMFWEVNDEHLDEADRASRRAVELDPDLAEAHVARGVAISLRNRHEEAGVEFETAIRLNSRLFDAYYFYARGFYARGCLEQAVEYFERAMAVRPEDYQAPSLLGSALAGLGRRDDSARAYRKALSRGQKHLEIHPGETRALYFSALALCQLGERKRESLAWAERALAMDPEEPQVLYNVGCVFALQGRTEDALKCLAATIAHGGWWRTWMKNDPDLARLHDESRFQELVRER